jgi:hypothetical protein
MKLFLMIFCCPSRPEPCIIIIREHLIGADVETHSQKLGRAQGRIIEARGVKDTTWNGPQSPLTRDHIRLTEVKSTIRAALWI